MFSRMEATFWLWCWEVDATEGVVKGVSGLLIRLLYGRIISVRKGIFYRGWVV